MNAPLPEGLSFPQSFSRSHSVSPGAWPLRVKHCFRCSVRPAAIALAFWAAALNGLAQAADQEALRPWTDYHTIMWIGDTAWKKPEKLPLFFQRLREMGVNTGMVHHDADPRPLVENHFPFYAENLVNRGLCLKFNSHVTDWDQFVTAWARTRTEAGLVRDYALDDPAWRASAIADLQHTVRQDMAHQPLAYDIRDELSTTISANPFDYDFSPIALASFRKWLAGQYHDLAALNAEWETSFKSWEEVKPFTTDQIKNRMGSGDAIPRGKPDWQAVEKLKFSPEEARRQPTRWNLAPWCDFRSYMDTSLASALDEIRKASHALDPRTPVGIEGAQMPSAFGGYDFWKLSRALDWIEPYDIGNSREIVGSFMPGKPVLTTVGESNGNAAKRRLWHLLLEGDKGCIVWWSEDCIDWKSDDYALTAKAKALAPVLQEMGSPLAHLFLRAEREFDPIAILYSQPSIQVDWLLESTEDGSTWLRRFSSYEGTHNRMLKTRDGWLKALSDLGYSPRFISTEELEQGAIKDVRAVVLPEAYALSDRAMAALDGFRAKAGNVLFGDGVAGLFDEHGKLRAPTPLEKAFPPAAPGAQCYARSAPKTGQEEGEAHPGDIAAYLEARLDGTADGGGWPAWLNRPLSSLVPVTVSGEPASARAAIFRYRLGNARLLAFERNVDYRMSEDLKQGGGNEALEKPVEFTARLKAAAHVYDLRSGKYLGLIDKIPFTLDPWQPSLFALFAQRVAGDDALGALAKIAP